MKILVFQIILFGYSCCDGSDSLLGSKAHQSKTSKHNRLRCLILLHFSIWLIWWLWIKENQWTVSVSLPLSKFLLWFTEPFLHWLQSKWKTWAQSRMKDYLTKTKIKLWFTKRCVIKDCSYPLAYKICWKSHLMIKFDLEHPNNRRSLSAYYWCHLLILVLYL